MHRLDTSVSKVNMYWSRKVYHLLLLPQNAVIRNQVRVKVPQLTTEVLDGISDPYVVEYYSSIECVLVLICRDEFENSDSRSRR